MKRSGRQRSKRHNSQRSSSMLAAAAAQCCFVLLASTKQAGVATHTHTPSGAQRCMHGCVKESSTRNGRAAALPRCCPAGKLATLKGTVTRMSHVRPLMADMGFTCIKCGCSVKVEFPDGRFAPPTSCGGEAVTNYGSLPLSACCSVGCVCACTQHAGQAAVGAQARQVPHNCVLALPLCASCADGLCCCRRGLQEPLLPARPCQRTLHRLAEATAAGAAGGGPAAARQGAAHSRGGWCVCVLCGACASASHFSSVAHSFLMHHASLLSAAGLQGHTAACAACSAVRPEETPGCLHAKVLSNRCCMHATMGTCPAPTGSPCLPG